MTTTPCWVAASMSILSTPMPARPTTCRRWWRRQHLGRHLGGRADRQAVIVADDRQQVGLGEAGADIGLEAALLRRSRRRPGSARRPPAPWAWSCSGKVRRRAGAGERPVEPGQQPLDIGGLDGGATPDTQARRRIAVAGDVEGHRLLASSPVMRLMKAASPARQRPAGNRRIGDREADRGRRAVVGLPGEEPTQGVLPPRARWPRGWRASARSAPAGRRSARPSAGRPGHPRPPASKAC